MHTCREESAGVGNSWLHELRSDRHSLRQLHDWRGSSNAPAINPRAQRDPPTKRPTSSTAEFSRKITPILFLIVRKGSNATR
eukprot:scaffold106889_cov11-Prasinocladus_malaysianus.AAC.1